MTRFFRPFFAILLIPLLVHAEPSAREVLSSTTATILNLIEPADGQAPQTFTTTLRITKADNLPKDLLGASLEITLQAPDHVILAGHLKNETYTLGRNGQELWIYHPDKQFGVVGLPNVPRFSQNPATLDNASLAPFELPLNKTLLTLSLKTLQARALADETLENAPCHVISLSPPGLVASLLHLPPSTVELAVRDADHLPMRLRYTDGKASLEAVFEHPQLSAPIPADRWNIHPNPGDNIEHTALSHLQNFLHIAPEILLTRNSIPTLGPATGQRSLVAVSGKGRLEMIDGTRVLFLKGTPEEIGTEHGTLLKKEIRDCSHRILYGIGVGSSFPKGKWFFGEIEAAQKRLAPYISSETYREIDAMADACGMTHEEGRLANFFPELFHCSGFALVGASVADGHVYHGRVLDYMRGIGLEKNAVVAVYQPAGKNAWVNITYAGFAGTVTAMNEKRISIGEMGGRGEGNWDGKPMAQLLREVMENASTLDQAVAILKKGPRTCEYYYVVADGNTHRAVGVKATPTAFETVGPGDSHPQLSRPVKDTVLLSAGKRYETLVDRVQGGFGKFDTDSARHLMDPPMCMTSNLHSVLFVPDTLDFYVANADSNHPASETRYTHYNLRELLDSRPPEAAWKFWK
jgi:hypothetical protein